MAVTSKGSKWEKSESCYIIIAFIPILNWIAFLYTGLTTNTKRWIYWSIFYATPLIFLIYFLNTPGGFSKDYSLLNRYCNIVQVMAIVHSFKIRKEFLIKLEAKQDGRIVTKDEIKSIIDKSNLVNVKRENNAPLYERQVIEKEKIIVNNGLKFKDKKEVEKTIDINIASESEIASLPSIGSILAKKAINYRETKGDFTSIEEFAEILSLKPHVVERIKPLVKVNITKIENKTEDCSDKQGRIIDF